MKEEETEKHECEKEDHREYRSLPVLLDHRDDEEEPAHHPDSRNQAGIDARQERIPFPFLPGSQYYFHTTSCYRMIESEFNGTLNSTGSGMKASRGEP